MYIHYKRGILSGYYWCVKFYEWRNLNQDWSGSECCWLIPDTSGWDE